jgi:hypothetical protein
VVSSQFFNFLVADNMRRAGCAKRCNYYTPSSRARQLHFAKNFSSGEQIFTVNCHKLFCTPGQRFMRNHHNAAALLQL